MLAAANVEYEVRILAVNTEGFGEFSSSIIFGTNEDGKILIYCCDIHNFHTPLFCVYTVPSAPCNLTVVANSSTSLQVTWEHPLCEYGILINYTVSKIILCACIYAHMDKSMQYSNCMSQIFSEQTYPLGYTFAIIYQCGI